MIPARDSSGVGSAGRVISLATSHPHSPLVMIAVVGGRKQLCRTHRAVGTIWGQRAAHHTLRLGTVIVDYDQIPACGARRVAAQIQSCAVVTATVPTSLSQGGDIRR